MCIDSSLFLYNMGWIEGWIFFFLNNLSLLYMRSYTYICLTLLITLGVVFRTSSWLLLRNSQRPDFFGTAHLLRISTPQMKGFTPRHTDSLECHCRRPRMSTSRRGLCPSTPLLLKPLSS